MNTLPIRSSCSITLLIAPSSAIQPLFDRIAQLALQGPVAVLDGGNAFQGYALSRALYRQASRSLAAEALRRVVLSRVFTCYQMTRLLTEEPFTDTPLLALDFLLTFYDQSVRAAERRRLLQQCIQRLVILSQHTPIAIWVRRRTLVPEDALPFVQMLVDVAGKVWQPILLPEPVLQQPALFPAG